MSRYSSSGSYDHHCHYDKACKCHDYKISWTVDFYYNGSRCLFPRTFSRWTDDKGAKRFCKKWVIEFPTQPVRG